jgi:GNAT superfamily N-acetyltransferase
VTLTSLLDSYGPVTSGRIRLASLTSDALAGMSSWLSTVLAPEWTPADLEAALRVGGGVLITDGDGEAIGLAVVLLDAPAVGCATLPFLAIDPARRFRGLGGEAGIALEAQLRSRGYQRVYAPVPDGRGLAVYFWLRLGFRPLTLLESPGPLIGLGDESKPGIWMLRDVP